MNSIAQLRTNEIASVEFMDDLARSGRFLLREGRPICVGLFQIAFDIFMPKFPSLFVVLENQTVMQDLKIFGHDDRKFVNRRSVSAETAELRFIFRR